MRIPDGEYLKQAQALCRRYGTLFVLDEVQTGFYRTGPFLAAHHFGVEPDMIMLAKALSGGLIPVGAVLMTDAVYNSTYSSFKRSIVHTSTFSENALAMRAGLATLEVLKRSDLGERAARLGEQLRQHACRAACRLRNDQRDSRHRNADARSSSRRPGGCGSESRSKLLHGSIPRCSARCWSCACSATMGFSAKSAATTSWCSKWRRPLVVEEAQLERLRHGHRASRRLDAHVK